MAVIWRGKEVEAEIQRRMAANVAYIGEVLLDVAREEVPVDKGDLRDSGTMRVDTATLTATVTFGLGLRTNYAYFQEYGTVDHGPNPFLRRSIERIRPDARRMMGGR